MNGTKRCLPILAIGLVFLFTSTLAADSTANFDSTLKIPTLACVNNQPITVTGPTTVNIQQNSTSDGTHVLVHMLIKADGQDANQTPYHVELEGNAQFDAAASSYDVPFHSVWVGQGTNVNFPLTGVVTVFINSDGSVTTVGKSVDLPTCTN